jgi:hypothetical protein
MNVQGLLLLYALVGAACAVAIFRRGKRPLHAALAVPLWPLWAPVVLSEPARAAAAAPGDAAARIAEALREGVAIAGGTSLEAMLNGSSAARIGELAQRVEARRAELRELLCRPEFELAAARQRVHDLVHSGRTRSLATARLHLSNVERLHAMAARDDEVLRELGELAEALRTQLLMVRFAGSSGEGIGDIVNDLWTRVEALSEAMDDAEPASARHDEPHPHPGRG